MGIRFGTWTVRSPYKAGSLMGNAEGTSKYKLDLVGVQGSGGTEVSPNQQARIHFSMGRGVRIMN
jgi:hypothetical protein